MLKRLLKKKRLSILVLILIGTLFLSGCAKTSCKCALKPVYPIAGEKVAVELEHLNLEDYPHTWEWIGRIDKLREELQ